MTANEIQRDMELVERCLAGDDGAFTRLVEIYNPRIFSLCRRMLRNREDAEDVSQDVFFKLYLNLPNERGEAKLSNWLYTVALNICRNLLRRRKLVRFISLSWLLGREDKELDPADHRPRPDQALEAKERAAFLEYMVSTLPYKQRSAFILRYYHGLPEADIARTLGQSVGNTRVKLHRAKMYLWRKYRQLNVNGEYY